MPAISTNFVGFEHSYLQTCEILSVNLKTLTTNGFTVKDSFHFAEEFVDQQLDFFMSNLNVDSLLTNIPLEETIEICTNEFFQEFETIEGLSKPEFKEILSLATKDLHFCFDGTPYKQINSVVMNRQLMPFYSTTKKIS